MLGVLGAASLPTWRSCVPDLSRIGKQLTRFQKNNHHSHIFLTLPTVFYLMVYSVPGVKVTAITEITDTCGIAETLEVHRVLPNLKFSPATSGRWRSYILFASNWKMKRQDLQGQLKDTTKIVI